MLSKAQAGLAAKLFLISGAREQSRRLLGGSLPLVLTWELPLELPCPCCRTSTSCGAPPVGLPTPQGLQTGDVALHCLATPELRREPNRLLVAPERDSSAFLCSKSEQNAQVL